MASDILDLKPIEERMESDDTLDSRKQLMKELESLFRHRETLFKELLMIRPSDDLESSFMDFLKDGDMAVLDTTKWDAHGENDKLRQILLSKDIKFDLNDTSSVDALDAHTALPQEIETSTDQANNFNKVKDIPVLCEPPSLAPISKTVQRTSIYTLPPGDSRLAPVQSYNNIRMQDSRADNADPLDLYAWTLKAKAQPLFKTLQTARKVLTTQDWNLARDELKSIKTVQQIEYLKSKHMWSLKQLRRHTSVPRTKTHWDSVLDEMKWMRTDFKEERKWKIASAYMIGRAVMDWHQTTDKSTVCVATRQPTPRPLNSRPMDIDTPPTLMEDRTMDHANSELNMDSTPLEGSTMVTDQQHQDNDMSTLADTTPDEEESDIPQKQVVSAAWELLYQQLIKDCDPYHTVITLPMENFQHLDITSLLPDCLMYAPPDPNLDDPYFNEAEYGRIVPLTKLSTLKVRPRKHNPRKRTIDGQPIDPYNMDSDVETLPNNERYDTTLVSPLFAPKKIKDTPAALPPTPQAPSSGARPPGVWTEEDDLCLISLIVQFSFNWELICDAFNSIRAPISVEKRSPWELHERWRQNNLTSVSGQVNPLYATKMENELTKRQSIVKFDFARKKQRQYSIFEAIKKTQRKREEIQKPTNNASTPRSTVESHGMNSNGKRLPTAMELSLHKVQRERQQALIEQRQLYGLNGTQGTNTNVGPRMHSSVASQVRPPTATTSVSGIQSTSSATPIMTNRTNSLGSLSMPNNSVGNNNNNNVIRTPQPIPSNQNQHPALNRYPSAQLQLLRQQQMALMAAAQQQQQVQQQVQQNPPPQPQQPVQQPVQQHNQLHQQQTPPSQALPQQQQASPMIRPPVSIPMQRFSSNPMMPMNQQPQGTANQSSTLASVMQQQQQQVQQQQQQQHASPVIQQQQSVPSQQQQQPQAPNNPATSLAFAAQLAQMGYPIQQLPSNQQAQLQRYLAQLQMRNAAAQQQQIRQQQQQHIQQQQGLGNGSLMGMSPQAQHQQVPPPQMMSSPLMNQHSNNNTSQHSTATNASAGYLAAQQQQQLQRFQQALLLQQQLQRQQSQQQLQLQHPHQQQHPSQPTQSSSPMMPHPSYPPPS